MIQFFIAGDLEFGPHNPASHLTLLEEDAEDLMRWIGLDWALIGSCAISSVKPLCLRRLWRVARNYDPARQEQRRVSPTGVAYVGRPGRPAGFLRAQTEALLRLMERCETDDGYLLWG